MIETGKEQDEGRLITVWYTLDEDGSEGTHRYPLVIDREAPLFRQIAKDLENEFLIELWAHEVKPDGLKIRVYTDEEIKEYHVEYLIGVEIRVDLNMRNAHFPNLNQKH